MSDNTMYTIYNKLEDCNVFTGNEKQFVGFIRFIVEENEDSDIIFDVKDAVEYVNKYCDNLELR